MAFVRTQSVLALLAAAALMAMTIGAVIRPAPASADREFLMLVVAWIAILTATLAGRARLMAGESGESEQASTSLRIVESPPAAAAAPTTPATPAAAVTAATPAPAALPRELLEFAQEIHGTIQSDQLRLLIARRLPALVGVQDVWAVSRFEGQQHLIVPPGPRTGQPPQMLGAEPRQWATFPMKADGRTVGVLGVGVDAGRLSESEGRVLDALAGILARSLKTAHTFEAMRRATLIDPLTGCATRAEGLRRLEAELRRAERSRTSLGVLMLDLDHFKSINDRFGHTCGDAVLSSVGQLLLGTLRASDVRCRWGGEEFLIVLPESSVGRAQRASEAIRTRIANAVVHAGAHSVHVTASIGMTVSRPGETDVQKLVARADAALYRAKNAGRNRVKVVLGDFQGEAIAAGGTFPAIAPSEGPFRTGPDRRNPAQADRRRIPSPGRRRTDPKTIAGPWR